MALATRLRSTSHWSDPRVKPPYGAVGIDTAHPLSVQMFDCLVFNEGAGRPINLVTYNPTTATSTPSWKRTNGGVAGYTTGGASFNIADHGNLAAGALTVRVRVIIDSYSETYMALFDKGTGGSRECTIFVNTSGEIQRVEVGGTPHDIATGNVPLNVINEIVITRTSASVGFSVYINGIFVVTSNVLGTTGLSTPLAIGRNASGGGGHFDGKTLLFNTWLRGMTTSEIIELYVNPYAFLRPIIRRRYFFFTPPAGAAENIFIQEHLGSGIGRGVLIGR